VQLGLSWDTARIAHRLSVTVGVGCDDVIRARRGLGVLFLERRRGAVRHDAPVPFSTRLGSTC
jgi:hypothetical protein